MLKKILLKAIIFCLIFTSTLNLKANNPILPYIYFEEPNSIYEPQCRKYADIVVVETFDDSAFYLDQAYNIYYSY